MTGWRELLPVHPAAQLFPRMTEAELRELADDIGKNGLHERVKIYKGRLLDGRNRLDALELHPGEAVRLRDEIGMLIDGKPFRSSVFEILADDIEPYAYTVSVNIRRRHLTQGQKRDLISELLQANPERSDRQTAKLANVDKNTVADVRHDMEERGEIHHIEKRKDSKGRSQPATKPKAMAPKPLDSSPAPLHQGSPDTRSEEQQFKEGPVAWRNRAKKASILAKYAPRETCPVSGKMLRLARAVVKDWSELVQYLEKELAREHPTKDATRFPHLDYPARAAVPSNDDTAERKTT
jgi:hypothetical protein